MIKIQIYQGTFLGWSVNLHIGVDGSSPNVVDQYSGDSLNLGHLTKENGGLTSIFGDGCDDRWRIISGKVLYKMSIYLVHYPNLFNDSVHLTMNALEIGA